ncbi:MAG: hypothetical protein DI535_17620 [Citrobacter freundii]|nr:MAG: hypothetical protein DI535_17620 [Citrobacter freundii]
MTYTDINKIGISLNERLDTLEFYKDDLDILDNRLLEISRKNTGNEVLQRVEHFQNQFDLQRQNISDLQHKIRSATHSCSEDVKFHNGKVSTVVTDSLKTLDNEIGLFEKNMKTLRAEYNDFLAKWM